MKIVFLIPSLRAGGAERVFANLLARWDLGADEVHLVVLRREGPYFDQIPAGVRVHSLEGRRFLEALPRLVSLVRSLRPDAVLVTHSHMIAAAALLKPLFRGARVVGRETNMPAQTGMAQGTSRWRRFFYGWGYRAADAVVCLSQAMADEVKALYKVPAGKIRLIPNPLLFDAVEAGSRAALDPDLAQKLPGRVWLAAVGRLESNKGFDLLLEALARLPQNLGAVVVGEGSQRTRLEALVQSLGLTDRVVLTGFDPNPHRYLAACRLFVLSSRYEGLPNAALEALSLGMPVAAFDGPWGAREIIREGVTGCLATDGDPASLAAAIERVLGSAWDREAIRSWTRGRYEAAAVVRAYREALQ